MNQPTLDWLLGGTQGSGKTEDNSPTDDEQAACAVKLGTEQAGEPVNEGDSLRSRPMAAAR